MRVKLTKPVIVNSVSNTQAVRAGEVVEVSDDDGRDLVKAGYAEESSAKVTAEARQAPDPQNKMAAEGENKAGQEGGDGGARGGNPTRAAGAAKTDTGTARGRG